MKFVSTDMSDKAKLLKFISADMSDKAKLLKFISADMSGKAKLSKFASADMSGKAKLSKFASTITMDSSAKTIFASSAPSEMMNEHSFAWPEMMGKGTERNSIAPGFSQGIGKFSLFMGFSPTLNYHGLPPKVKNKDRFMIEWALAQ